MRFDWHGVIKHTSNILDDHAANLLVGVLLVDFHFAQNCFGSNLFNKLGRNLNRYYQYQRNKGYFITLTGKL